MNLRLLTLVTSLCLLLGSPRIASAQGVSGGDVPLPVKVVGGISQLSWNGTYAELLAADALAMCQSTQTERHGGRVQSGVDPMIIALYAKINAASCKATCASPPVIDGGPICMPVDIWLDSRKDPTCNVDASTGLPRA